MDSSQNVQLYIFQNKKKCFKFISTSGLDFYRAAIDCDKNSILKTRDPETSVLVELSKSSCSVPPPVNLDLIDSRVILSMLAGRPYLLKAGWLLPQRQLLREDQWPQQRCCSQSRRTSFQAAEALTWRHVLKCCLKDTWTTHKHILPEQRPGSSVNIGRDCIWSTNFSAFNLHLFKG